MTLEDSFAEYLYAHEEQETCHIPRNNEYHVTQEKRGFKNIVTNWNSTNNTNNPIDTKDNNNNNNNNNNDNNSNGVSNGNLFSS